MAIITKDQVKQHFPQLVGTSYDTNLDDLIARIDALAASYIGLPPYDTSVSPTLEDQTYTLYPAPHWEHPDALDVALRPLLSVTTAHVDDLWVYDSSTQVASTDMVVDSRKGLVWLKPNATSTWSGVPRSNKLVVVAGFTACPLDLVPVLAFGVHHLADLGRTLGVKGSTFNGASVTRDEAVELLPQAVLQALSPYVLWESRLG